MNYDRLTFMDAVEDLAKRVGIEVPERRPAACRHRRRQGSVRRAGSQQRSSSSNSWRPRDKAKSYLSKRGVDGKSLDAVRHRLCAGRLQRTNRRARHRRSPQRPAGKNRHAVEVRQRPGVRQIPRPHHVPDLRPARAGDRVRRPRAGKGRWPEIPEFAGNPAVPQRPRAVWPVAGASRRTAKSRA